MPTPSPLVLVYIIQSVLALTVRLVLRVSLPLRKTKFFRTTRSFMAPPQRGVHGVEEGKFKRLICAGNTLIIWRRPCQNSIVSGAGTERRQSFKCAYFWARSPSDNRLLQIMRGDLLITTSRKPDELLGSGFHENFALNFALDNAHRHCSWPSLRTSEGSSKNGCTLPLRPQSRVGPDKWSRNAESITQ